MIVRDETRVKCVSKNAMLSQGRLLAAIMNVSDLANSHMKQKQGNMVQRGGNLHCEQHVLPQDEGTSVETIDPLRAAGVATRRAH